ncbi:hypothetical protein ACEQPO_25480 [Bacillus sp. SL00103]
MIQKYRVSAILYGPASRNRNGPSFINIQSFLFAGALMIWGVCAGIQAIYNVTSWWELFCIGGFCFFLYMGYLYQFAGIKRRRRLRAGE